MPICKKCDKRFPNRIEIDGKITYLHRRSYCLECSPIGERLRSGPLPVDGSDPFDNNRPRYPSGKLRCKETKENCLACNEQFVRKHHYRVCNSCRSDTQRRTTKRELVDYKGGKCISCGYDKWQTLHFHHLDPSIKEFNLSTGYGHVTKKILYQEADKCVLLCPNCHYEYHAGLRKLTDH